MQHAARGAKRPVLVLRHRHCRDADLEERAETILAKPDRERYVVGLVRGVRAGLDRVVGAALQRQVASLDERQELEQVRERDDDRQHLDQGHDEGSAFDRIYLTCQLHAARFELF